MSTHSLATYECDTTVSTLIDVLPCAHHEGGNPSNTLSFVFPLDGELAEADSLSLSMELCAALIIGEARLTGSDSVLATLVDSDGTHQAIVDVPRDAVIETWLAGLAQSLPMTPSIRPATWSVVAPGLQGDGTHTSQWRLSSTDGETIHVDARDPFNAQAAQLYADVVQRVLYALRTQPMKTLGDIDILDAEERQQSLVVWNATAKPRRAGDTVHTLFDEVASAHGDRIAVIDQHSRLTYADLSLRANQLAARLQEVGIKPGDMVGVMLGRSVDAVTAILGVIKAGGAYTPLDMTYPEERLAFMLKDADVRVVVTPNDDHPLPLPANTLRVQVSAAGRSPTPQDPGLNGEALAYVMYTSGSTGTPKGVEIRHNAIIRLVRDVDYVSLDTDTRLLHAAPLGFDASTLEIWGALLNGGCTVVHDEAIPTGAGLARTITQHGITTSFLTTALFNAIVDADPRHLASLRELFTGGEKVSVWHMCRALAALPETSIVHVYGPTECTTFASAFPVPRDLAPDTRTIPIGGPIADTSFYVLNRKLEPIPVGVTGELFIGGVGVARGYLRRPELNAERFVPNGFGDESTHLYRTGDLVRWLPQGVIEFVGRADNQVKIRGYRIEIGEIEAAMRQLPGVHACAVLAREDQPGQKRLVAYYVNHGNSVTARQLREQLAQHLPEFMVPVAYLRLDSLPVTANGKLDRRALPAPGRERPELAGDFVSPTGQLESKLCALFADVLNLDQVGAHDHFFDLGGNSLLAVKLIERVHAEVSAIPTIPAFFADPTPAGVSALVEGRRVALASRLASGRKANASEPVAIIAMAGRFPGADNVETFWRNLCDGRETITRFTPDQIDPAVPAAERNDEAYVAARGVIDDVEMFDAAFFGVSPREAELMDPQQRIFLELCWECLERGGYIPDAQPVPVGVFGGMYHATYFQRHISTRQDLVDKLGAFQVMLANEKDFFTTRVAHKLNLTGPAISLNTACSTSLVALCQAVAALRAGQCEMALTGGVSVTCPPRAGYLSQEGSMLSPDGHTRSFDAQAQGTVFSDGAAVLLLKRLSDAQRDGDTIHAVIRGIAVNNDGGVKASFTAPSSAGQAAVITMALADAGVEPRSISYVETHGTATPLGDPIEIEGLTTAFHLGTDERGYCAIGSVKSNMGHLVMAAGATGVIKTALSLRERTLPPTLHFTVPNPKLSLENTPFFVNRELRAWTNDNAPLRAGVSSFGVGGTNAHAILEESPPQPASDAAEGPQLLLLSARTPSASVQAAGNLATHLSSSAQNLADVAYTLVHGRKAFAQRLHVVATDAADATQRLAALSAPQVRSAGQPAPDIVFLFPGQGSQYAGMGRALYGAEPVFRAAIDACAELLHEELGFDLRERLFADDADALRETALTQPATFAIEYALAQLWLSLGVSPVAMIGHSVGEFVAATLAGVMSLADGIRLVARRGRLMQAQPAGAMLSVRMDAVRLLPRLPDTVQLAANNSPNASVVSGETHHVEALRAALDAEGIACRLLQTSHAFHSAMMDPVLAPFRAEVARVTLSAPRTTIVSTLTGKVLAAEEATSPDYWTNHLRGAVRFSSALCEQLSQPARVFLEVGPRSALSTLARQHPQARTHTVVPSLADAPESEQRAWLDAVGELWCAGGAIDLAPLDRRQHRQRVCLPTYPFERKRYWIDAAPLAAAPAPARADNVVPLFTPSPAPAVETPMDATLPGTSTGSSRLPRLLAQLTELFEDVAGTELEGVDPSSGFVELGLDSLALTQVALQLQKTFALKITFRELMESFSSFERLAMHIDQMLPPDSAAPATPQPTTTAMATPTVAPLTAPTITAFASGNLVQDLIQQQMLIMQQQLALLAASASGTQIAAVAAPAQAPTPAATPVAKAAVAPQPTAQPAAQDEEAALAHTTYDVKKAFGAIARIHSTHTELSERQRARLDAFMRRYIDRTRASKEYTQRHRARLADPRVVNGFRPLTKEIVYQIVINRSKGSKVWDLDGNEYVDALNGFGMNLFGWQPDFVLDAVRRQLDAGYEIGPQHPLAGEVAEQICELTGFDRAALCNTGSEAVMGTIRIARTVTGRDTLVIFTGSYHGIFDEVIVRGTKKLKSVPAAPGILRNTSENVLVLDYGTPESLQIIRDRASSIAAVLVEPVQSRRPDFQPREFLKELRAITADAGALLIFDEVVTGFRSHPQGAQHVLGIDADLASYGKVVGGGFPIGVIAGKRRFMDALDGGSWQYGDDSIPTVGVTYFAGTFVRHPLALAAAHAVLNHLKDNGSALQERLNTRTALLMDELNAFCASVGAPIQLVHFASVWKTNFTEDHPLQDLLFAMMRSRGIHVLDNFPCFFTTAHAEQDFVAIAKAFKESVLELQEAEFLPRHRNVEALALDATRPPVNGARLGKDPDGNPAWFVPNPDAPGKYMRVNA